MHYRTFSRRQKLVLTWWKHPAFRSRDGIICDGSVRSGKTVSMAVGFLLWSMETFDRQRFALCGKTIESLRRNVSGLLPQWMEGLCSIEERRGENRLTVRMNGHENDYYLFGGKDERSYALIQGMTLAGVLFDEVALMPRSFVEQALARCSVEGSKFWFNCNPEGPTHWFYQIWLTRAEERNLLYLHFTMEDNPALSPAIRQRYERLYTGVFYQRYVQGLWAAAKGLIYDMFRPEVHVTEQLPEAGRGCYVSIDYGTQNPTVFLLWQKGERGRWYCLREYYWSGRDRMRQKTDGEYADDLEVFLDGAKPRAVIVDPSAASFIALLRQRGYPVLGADNQVLSGIRRVGDLLREERLLFSPGCVRTVEEFRSYVWDEDETGQDRPVKDHDHCMDALRYFVSTVLARSQARAGKRPKGL
ncbi:MAG: PBSX family phage terminase large subunit [Clostridiales bacterium]|nr:PBSX family phage terminase large subunit [Clostridiales bacterium]